MPGETREPQQKRSREKFARILQATATLLETTTYDELGTKLIAARSGVSIGVLYRYFADKEAIVASLVREWLQLDIQIAERITADPLPQRSRDLLENLLAAYADRFRDEPGYRRVWYQGPHLATLDADGKETNDEIARHLHGALVRGYAIPDTEQSRRRTRLAVDVGAKLLDLAFRDRTEGDPEILADAALMMDRYLFAPSDSD
jgi:AcrR family transcriptional regulator